MSAASPRSPQPSAPPSTTVPASTDPNSTQLYINNLSFNTTPEGLTAFFASSLSQPPEDVNIILHKHSGRSKGFGFVRVSNQDAPAALALNGRELDGRELGIAEAVEKTEEERTAQRARRDARRAAVQAKRKAEAGGGQAASGSAAIDEAGGASITSSDRSLPRPRPVREPRVVPDNHTQLYVSNLSYAVTTEQLKKEVEDTIGGATAEVDIIKRKGGASDGRSRGYGFVTVPNDKLDKALTLNGRSIEDRAVTVVIAKERPVREPAAATGGDEVSGGAAPGGGARRKRTNRRRGPRTNGDGTPDTAESAPAATGNIYADGSSAPSPAGPDATGNQRRRQPRARKPRGGGQGNGQQSEVAATQQ